MKFINKNHMLHSYDNSRTVASVLRYASTVSAKVFDLYFLCSLNHFFLASVNNVEVFCIKKFSQ